MDLRLFLNTGLMGSLTAIVEQIKPASICQVKDFGLIKPVRMRDISSARLLKVSFSIKLDIIMDIRTH